MHYKILVLINSITTIIAITSTCTTTNYNSIKEHIMVMPFNCDDMDSDSANLHSLTTMAIPTKE